MNNAHETTTPPSGESSLLGLSCGALEILRLLTERQLSGAQLAELVPEVDQNACLAELDRVRLIRPGSELGTYFANPPHAAADELLRIQEAHASQQLAGFARMREDYAKLADDLAHVDRGAPLTHAEIIESSEDVRSRIKELSATVTRSAWAAHPNLPSVEALEVGIKLDVEHATRGIDIRGLYPHAARRHQIHSQHLRTMQASGCNVRTAQSIPFRVILIDEAIAIVPRPDAEHGAAILRDPMSVAFIRQTFENLWQGAEGFDTEATVSEAAAEEIVVAILQELALGHTDETIARRLGISTRTLRRHLSKVTDKHHAQTRYQLGIVAMRHFSIGVRGEADAANELISETENGYAETG